MKKKINMLGIKVPVIAILIALLVIGTASAALIVNYATLTGEVAVYNPIGVIDGDNTLLPRGTDGVINFDGNGVATFKIDNGGVPANVNLVTTLMLDQDGPATLYEPVEVTDTEGITITYTIGGASYPLTGVKGQVLPDQTIPLATAYNTITVTFDGVAGLETGIYSIIVAINPYIAPL